MNKQNNIEPKVLKCVVLFIKQKVILNIVKKPTQFQNISM